MKIVRYPHPALRHPARPVRSIDKQLRLQVGEMFELMYEARGVGLAATQVALPCQLLVMNLSKTPGDPADEKVFINPVLTRRKGSVEADEGCLSFPGMYARVNRAKQVWVEAYDLDGNKVEFSATDMEARAWQHEIDHLNGALFIDKFGAIAKLTTHREIKAFESEFRKAQEYGQIPADAELKRLLVALESEL